MLIKHFSYFIPLQFAICNYFVFFAVNVFHGNGMSFIGIPFALLRLAGEKNAEFKRKCWFFLFVCECA